MQSSWRRYFCENELADCVAIIFRTIHALVFGDFGGAVVRNVPIFLLCSSLAAVLAYKPNNLATLFISMAGVLLLVLTGLIVSQVHIYA